MNGDDTIRPSKGNHMRLTAASPLRYPGGKTCLLPVAVEILRTNDLDRAHYAEPFAGGCGLALALLYGGHVAHIHLNDIDPAVYAFWISVLDHNSDLIQMVKHAILTVDEWQRQREIVRSASHGNLLELGFAAFYLNRTNHSGVIKDAGVMGGIGQTGSNLIDCRFNKDDLVRRIERIARYRSQIQMTRLDAIDFLAECENLPKRSLIYADPPYYKKGPGLYTSHYRHDDHVKLASRIQRLKRPWMVTYDDVEPIRALYRDRQAFSFDIRYTLREKRRGSEIMVLGDVLQAPRVMDTKRVWWTSPPEAVTCEAA